MDVNIGAAVAAARGGLRDVADGPGSGGIRPHNLPLLGTGYRGRFVVLPGVE